MKTVDPISLALVLTLASLLPVLFVLSTSFLKISMVAMIVRNALGVQQVPPNMAIYALSLILTLHVMAPVFNAAGDRFAAAGGMQEQNLAGTIKAAREGVGPVRAFMFRHADPRQRAFFVSSTRQLWPPEMAKDVHEDDLLIVAPAFVVTEMTKAFEVGFLLYLPFVVIDLVVSNILLALGMMMVSPSTISLPLKLLLFVMVDGWTRLLHGLILSYA